MFNNVTSACSSQYRYFAVTSKECYTPRLWTTVSWVGGHACCKFHGMVQCYRQMLRIAVTIRSNFLYLVTSLQTALVTRRNPQWCYIMVLYVCTHLKHSNLCQLLLSTFKPHNHRRHPGDHTFLTALVPHCVEAIMEYGSLNSEEHLGINYLVFCEYCFLQFFST